MESPAGHARGNTSGRWRSIKFASYFLDVEVEAGEPVILRHCGPTLDLMSREPTKSSGRALHQWRITLVRAKGQNSLVEAPDAGDGDQGRHRAIRDQRSGAAAPLGCAPDREVT
jgi:hypothetical protein